MASCLRCAWKQPECSRAQLLIGARALAASLLTHCLSLPAYKPASPLSAFFLTPLSHPSYSPLISCSTQPTLHTPQDTAHRKHADLRKDPHRQDHHARSRELRHYRQCQEQDPGQGGNSPGPTALDLRRQAA
ncbi:hypothetical protein BKA58DRAFT_225061 [Alternaria rosae]|uniref:uncharacterized protein n=1 Tax=Alternaria rosae TaxID=1187941 RepID=UPI001E8DFFD6|nr:uncharacterized protein BKA58DRAFT_225061 [Alternaria rosae]KAH6865635.1 hypothetical protein BKA58DRAFT_225061 [Alternaria rosae]